MTAGFDDDALLAHVPTWYRWRYGVRWGSLLGWALLGVLLVGYSIARRAAEGHGIAFGVAVGVVMVVIGVAVSAFARPGVRVTAERQPDLYALVHDVAQRAGFRAPNRIWLTHTPSVVAQVRTMRCELLIGQALVPCLTEPQLRSMITHELTILQFRRARLVARLNTMWTAATIITHRPSASTPARPTRAALALQPFGEAVHGAADAAAISAAGTQEEAARALVTAAMADTEYDYLAEETAAPARRWWQNGALIEDLHDAWRRWITHSSPVKLRGPEAITLVEHYLGRSHPRLAGGLRSLIDQDVSLVPTTPAVRLNPLTRRQERLLVRRLRGLGTMIAVRWHTCSSAPASWWTERARAGADRIRKAVVEVLGRAPVDEFETAEVLIMRNEEILGVLGRGLGESAETDQLEPDAVLPDPSDYEPPPVLRDLVEDALLAGAGVSSTPRSGACSSPPTVSGSTQRAPPPRPSPDSTLSRCAPSCVPVRITKWAWPASPRRPHPAPSAGRHREGPARCRRRLRRRTIGAQGSRRAPRGHRWRSAPHEGPPHPRRSPRRRE